MTNRIVIGLDYGTTYTGVAFQGATVTGAAEGKVNLVMGWPPPPGKDAEKVPSEISYSPSPADRKQWGYDFDLDSLKLSWTKLELDQQQKADELDLILKGLTGTKNLDFQAIERSYGLPSYPARDPEDIIADYLTQVRQHLWDYLVEEYGPVLLAGIAVDLVITVPAMWSESARNQTYRAVCKAGFDKPHFRGLRRVIMITEPEATFYSLVNELRPRFGQVAMLPGESFVVCDAGGGTVDLSSYRITQIDPKFECTPIAVSTGAKCGATFIDRNFKIWLEGKLGAENFRLLTHNSASENIGSHTVVEPKMVGVMDSFTEIKERFEGIGHPAEDEIALPYPLNSLEDEENGISRGEIRITDHDLREMFRFSVDSTIELISSQISQVRQAGSTVRYVFLSGGFASSKYLYNEVDMFLRMHRVRMELAQHSWSAVVRGAVARGIGTDQTNLVHIRKCSRHYGVSVSQIFSRSKHSEEDAYVDPFDGQKKAKDQMIWLIKKGDGIFSDRLAHPSINLRRAFGRTGRRIFRTALVSSEEDIPPDRLADVPIATQAIATLNYGFDDIGGDQVENVRGFGRGQGHVVANFKIELRLEEANMTFAVSVNGQELKAAAIPYAP